MAKRVDAPVFEDMLTTQDLSRFVGTQDAKKYKKKKKSKKKTSKMTQNQKNSKM